MKYEKLTNPNITMNEMIYIMSEGNPGALTVLAEIMKEPNGILDILSLDSLDIRGSKLYMLWNDCCGRDFKKFKRTLQLLRTGVFDHEEIMANLDRVRALPFIDDDLNIEGIPSYDEEFNRSHPKWQEFVQLNKENLLNKIDYKPEGRPRK